MNTDNNRDVLNVIKNAPSRDCAIYDLIVSGYDALANWLVARLDNKKPQYGDGDSLTYHGTPYLEAIERLP
jgi:hypothetical protein